jgi:hypothetical protein
MNFDSWLIVIVGLFVSLEMFYVKRRLDHSLRAEFDKQVESFRQSFQRELASIQALYSYKQLSIKSAFEQTCALNERFWNAYWSHQDLWSHERMEAGPRQESLRKIQDFREFLFSHQIYLDSAIYETCIRAVTNMLALSRFRAVNRQPPEVSNGRDSEMEREIERALSDVVRLIREKFELPAIPNDLRIPPRPAVDVGNAQEGNGI